LTLGANVSLNQDLQTTDSPTFGKLLVNGQIAGSHGRFSGWYVAGGATGLALEAGIESGAGWILSYNRATSTYANVGLSGLHCTLTIPATAYSVLIDGGLHVGGTSDPGDNNLLVDGTTTSTGDIIATGGNVGIGTTTPGAKLEVAGWGRFTSSNVVPTSNVNALETYFYSGDTTGNVVSINRGTSTYLPLNLVGSYIALFPNGSEVLRATGGKVGIGTTAPNTLLDVNGKFSNTGSRKQVESNNIYQTDRKMLLELPNISGVPYARLGIPSNYQGHNGGGILIRASWTGSHATGSSYREYQLAYGTDHMTGPAYLVLGRVSSMIRTRTTDSYPPYAPLVEPDIDFYYDPNVDAQGYAGLVMHVLGADSVSYHWIALLEANFLGRSPTPLVDPLFTNIASLPANSFLLGKENVLMGNTGIGTTAPNTQLHLDDTSNVGPQITLSAPTDGSPGIIFRPYQTSAQWSNPAQASIIATDSNYSADIHFYTKDPGAIANALVERMTILGSGKVGIGTTAPAAKLVVNGGLHVGGNTDPGNTNLKVDGTAEVTGQTNLGTVHGTTLLIDHIGEHTGSHSIVLDNNVVISADVYTTAWTDYAATSTIVGWSGSPTKLIYYKKVGKLVFVQFEIFGTSDNAGATFTLPYDMSNVVDARFAIETIDLGVTDSTPGMGQILQGEPGKAKFYRTWAGGAFMDSGSKGIKGQFWYHTA
jgi:hypothetical protein